MACYISGKKRVKQVERTSAILETEVVEGGCYYQTHLALFHGRHV